MEARKLRIGNWVKEGRVCALDNLQAWTSIEGIVLPVEYKELTPIPLTEQWLLRCGFERTENHNIFLHPVNRFFSIILIDGSYFYYVLHVEIKHVHEVQNLYYALTGEELKLKS